MSKTLIFDHLKAAPISIEMDCPPRNDALYGCLSIPTFYKRNSGDTDAFFLYENYDCGNSANSAISANSANSANSAKNIET